MPYQRFRETFDWRLRLTMSGIRGQEAAGHSSANIAQPFSLLCVRTAGLPANTVRTDKSLAISADARSDCCLLLRDSSVSAGGAKTGEDNVLDIEVAGVEGREG